MKFDFDEMKRLNNLYEYGEHLTDGELAQLLDFYNNLYKSLTVMGEKYELARLPILNKLENLERISEFRKFK